MSFNKNGEVKVFKKSKKENKTASEKERFLISDLIKESGKELNKEELAEEEDEDVPN